MISRLSSLSADLARTSNAGLFLSPLAACSPGGESVVPTSGAALPLRGLLSSSRVEQLAARRAHNPKVAGSSPASATNFKQREPIALHKPALSGFFKTLLFSSLFMRATLLTHP